MKKFLLMLLPLAALVTGCRYDDSEVWEELNNHEQRILALEKAINTDLASVQGIVAELQKKVYVSSVTPTANGFTLTFTDGKSYTVTNGTSGETPNIGVKQDTDGNYYWTLNGEWLKDAAGNKIRTTGDQGVAGITPQVKIQDNKWYVSIDNGQTWTEAGAATVVGDSLFKEVKLDADGKNVIFTFQDGSTITIPVVPVVKKLQLIFDETQIASIMSGATATVDYEITGPEDETVEFDTFENNGYKVVVTPADATKGTIAVTAPDPAVKGKVLFILTGSKGSSFVKTVTINANPAVTPDKTEYNVDSKAGEVEITVAANIAYTSKIVATKAEDITWITKGSAENKFVVTENATLEDRSVNIVFSAEGVKDVTVKLTQACKDAIVVTAEDLSKEIVATEGTLDIVIRTNVEVTATPDVDWITLDEGTKALADKKFSFKIAANTGSVERVGHIDFTAGELKQTVTVTQTFVALTIAEIAALEDGKTFEGNFKNVIVTHAVGKYTYLEDESGAIPIYADGVGLTAGKVINGKVSGAKGSHNKAWQITAIDYSNATLTDGTVTEKTMTIAQLLENYDANYGRRIKLVDVKVTDGMTGGSDRNGKVEQNGSELALYNSEYNHGLYLVKDNIVDLICYPTYYNENKQASVFSGLATFKSGPDVAVSFNSKLNTEGDAFVLPAEGGTDIDFGRVIITNIEKIGILSLVRSDAIVITGHDMENVISEAGYHEKKLILENVTKNEGTTARNCSMELKITDTKGVEKLKTTIKFIQPVVTSGGGETTTKELSFGFTSNPGGWPTANSTTPTNYTYTVGGVDYSFSLKNVKQNNGYLMVTQPGALGLPAISGYKLTKVVAKNSSGCSTSVIVGISSSNTEAGYISGGEAKTFSTQSAEYTYNLTGTSANTMYYIYVTKKNCQLVNLDLTYEKVD